MQLLALALYARDGRRRDVRFEPGKLNIVTGESKTGKSALLTITEFCLGRDRYLIPAGPIADHVAWYGSLWQLTDDPAGPRAFVGRPAPDRHQATVQRAMLEFGGSTLDLLAFDQLIENADTDGIRRQLGRRIGIEENVIQSRGPGMNQTPFEAHLGHAAWLCLQDQDEIASRFLLFHRQGDTRVAEHLKDTIPYFIGAVPADAAAKRTALRDAQRALRRAESALSNAENEASAVDTTLRGLLAEAHAVGLSETNDLTDRAEIVAALRTVRRAVGVDDEQAPNLGGQGAETSGISTTLSPAELQDRRRELQRRREDLRIQLAEVMDGRALLLDRRDADREFADAVALHAGRLTSLELLPAQATEDDHHQATADAFHPDSACPVCGSMLETPDPSTDALLSRLTELRDQLNALDAAPESRGQTITRLEGEAERLRGELSSVERAIDALDATDQQQQRQRQTDAARNYTRGRIDAYLNLVETAADTSIARLRTNVTLAEQRLSRLAGELDQSAEREQLHSRLNVVGRAMTEFADELGLEHVENGVRLDLAELTVVTDTSKGPLPLSRIGSAANWIGYHLATHLALHKFFAENDRPVPRFLMLDQPTQAYYPSDAAKNEGQVNDADRDAVTSMFRLMYSVVSELAPRMQIIVSDHLNLVGEPWFQESLRHEWRNGERLVPAAWIESPA